MLDMGVEPYLVTAALRGVAAQRLVRRLCSSCREAYVPAADAWERRYLRLPADGQAVLYRPKGCPECHGTGYRGRLALREVVELTPALKRQILEGATEETLTLTARGEGVVFLAEDGWCKVLAGATSAEELLRVLGVA